MSSIHTALTVEYSVFEHNLPNLNSLPTASFGNAVSSVVNNQGIRSTFSDCEFRNNPDHTLTCDGSFVVQRCRFDGNRSGLLIDGQGPSAVFDCTFSNHFGGTGGLLVSGSTSIANCLVMGNAHGINISSGNPVIANSIIAGNGRGITVSFASFRLLNSVVYANTDVGIDADSGYMANSIVWGNTDSIYQGEDAQIHSSGTLTLQYNSVEGWTGALGGVGNADIDPMFVDPDGPDGIPGTLDEDFHLASDSPLINFGHPNPPLYPNLDFDHHARILCGRIDIGAYERGIGDYNCDDMIDLSDYAAFPTCFTGPAPTPMYPPACAAYDFVADYAAGTEDIDLLDLAAMQNGFSEP